MYADEFTEMLATNVTAWREKVPDLWDRMDELKF